MQPLHICLFTPVSHKDRRKASCRLLHLTKLKVCFFFHGRPTHSFLCNSWLPWEKNMLWNTAAVLYTTIDKDMLQGMHTILEFEIKSTWSISMYKKGKLLKNSSLISLIGRNFIQPDVCMLPLLPGELFYLCLYRTWFPPPHMNWASTGERQKFTCCTC